MVAGARQAGRGGARALRRAPAGQARGLSLFPGEPAFGPWRPAELTDLLGGGGARVVAVDGRSGAGKTTLANALAATVPRSAVVHTDDIAWFLARFDWVEEMRAGVLEPVRRGEAVAYRPPPWDERSRPGAVEVPACCEMLVVEGVGAARAELADLVDRAVWVQSDREVARERGIERDGGDAAGWDEWQSEEIPFLESDRPWERAGVIVAGTGLALPGAVLIVRRPR